MEYIMPNRTIGCLLFSVLVLYFVEFKLDALLHQVKTYRNITDEISVNDKLFVVEKYATCYIA